MFLHINSPPSYQLGIDCQRRSQGTWHPIFVKQLQRNYVTFSRCTKF